MYKSQEEVMRQQKCHPPICLKKRRGRDQKLANEERERAWTEITQSVAQMEVGVSSVVIFPESTSLPNFCMFGSWRLALLCDTVKVDHNKGNS